MKSLLETYSNITTGNSIRIAIVGDIMQHEKQLAYEESRQFAYSNIFDNVNNANYDLVVGNLETTISTNQTTGFPKFAAHPNFLRALKEDAKFDILVTSNNHTSDYGDAGIINTFNEIIQNKMEPVGTCGKSVSLCDIKGHKIAIHSFSTITNVEDSERSELQNFEISAVPGYFNIAYAHAGEEYNNKPTEYQRIIAQNLKEKSFNGVVFAHSHVVSTFEEDSSGFFVHWGLGNFISDQINLDKQLGQTLVIEFSNESRSFQFINTQTLTDAKGKSSVIELSAVKIQKTNMQSIKEWCNESLEIVHLESYFNEAISGDSLTTTKFELLNDVTVSAIKTTLSGFKNIDPATFNDNAKDTSLKAGTYNILSSNDKYAILRKTDKAVYIVQIEDIKKSYFKTDADIFD